MFNSCTTGVNGLMLIIVTNDDCIFGCYNSLPVPLPPSANDTVYIEKDVDYFVFTLKNPHGIKETQFKRKKATSTLRICPNEGEAVVGASDCFSIFSNNSYIIPTFGSYYVDSTGKGSDIFVGSHYPTRFAIKKMYGIQWV